MQPVRLERLWDDVAKQHERDIWCAYPASNVPGGEDERAFQYYLRGAFGCPLPLNNLPSANPARVVWLRAKRKNCILSPAPLICIMNVFIKRAGFLALSAPHHE